MCQKKIIVDSDFLVALYKPDDSSHVRSIEIAGSMKQQGYIFIALNLVVQESTTVISNKMGMEDARRFYKGLENMLDQTIDFHKEIEKISWSIFLKQTKKGSSFIDCANLATMKFYKIGNILSFDASYPKEARIN